MIYAYMGKRYKEYAPLLFETTRTSVIKSKDQLSKTVHKCNEMLI